MPSLVLDPHRHHPHTPLDLRWSDTVRVEEEATEIMVAAAQRTVIEFAGDSATLINQMLFGKAQS